MASVHTPKQSCQSHMHDQLVQVTQAGQPQTEHRDLTLMQNPQNTEKQQQKLDA